jgi:hypothetical protein
LKDDLKFIFGRVLSDSLLLLDISLSKAYQDQVISIWHVERLVELYSWYIQRQPGEQTLKDK